MSSSFSYPSFVKLLLLLSIIPVSNSSISSYRQPIYSNQLAHVMLLLVNLPRVYGTCRILTIGGDLTFSLPHLFSHYFPNHRFSFISFPNYIFLIISLLLLPFPLDFHLISFIFQPICRFPYISDFSTSPTSYLHHKGLLVINQQTIKSHINLSTLTPRLNLSSILILCIRMPLIFHLNFVIPTRMVFVTLIW